MWNILLTGATGFLGGELAVLLARMEPVRKLICLVRARSDHEAARRLDRTFAQHRDIFDRGKVIAIAADLNDDLLSQKLSGERLLSDINLVIHAAADTSFIDWTSESINDTNVYGTERLAEWALQLQRLVTFVYVGTAAIVGSGVDVASGTIYEDDAPRMDARHLVGYTRSKMLGEMAVKSRIQPERLLVVRPSNLLGQAGPVVPRSFDIAWIIAAVKRLRMFFSDPDALCDVIPVDYAAYAIVRLILAPRSHTTYHISSGDSASTYRQILQAAEGFASGKPPLAFCSRTDLDLLKKWLRATSGAAINGYSEQFKYIRKKIGSREAVSLLNGLDPYWDFLDLNQRFDNSRLLEDTGIRPPESVHQYLKRTMRFEDLVPLQAVMSSAGGENR